MIATATNTVPTSSCGRLFDAVAAIVGLRREVTFEGQAAIELEAIADPACTGRYPFEITGDELDFRPMIECIVREHERPPVVAARFHNTLAAAIHQVCVMLRQEAAINRVCLSGGAFQNMRLLGITTALLRASAFEVYLHREVPPNDGGLALGQAAIAAERLRF
jgi:hydrogenase maturation protein HypF